MTWGGDRLITDHKECLCPNTSGMVYWPAMKDRREEQLVLMAECCLSCIAKVSSTSVAATPVTPTYICTLTRLLDKVTTEPAVSHLHQLLVNVGLVEADVNRVPGGHHVVVVDNLEEKNFMKTFFTLNILLNYLILLYSETRNKTHFLERIFAFFLLSSHVFFNDCRDLLP